MNNLNLGYCCINLTLQESDAVSTNRSMIRKTFNEKGIKYASELALKNIEDLQKVIQWNLEHGVKVYRMSSDMFPWMSEYELTDLPDFKQIQNLLQQIGTKVQEGGLRLTFHPGPFNVLASPKPEVVKKAYKELKQHGQILDLMGLPRTPYYPINIHIGGTYNDKETTLKRFCEAIKVLDDSAKSRLVIENDDKLAQYTVEDLYYGMHVRTGLPITFDFLHHQCNPGNLTEAEALGLAVKAWPKDIVPITHYSSSKKVNEDATSIFRAHADYIYENIDPHGYVIDVELESKAKELALLKYRKDFEKSL